MNILRDVKIDNSTDLLNINSTSSAPYTFANTGQRLEPQGDVFIEAVNPRHQIFMEGAGILIPPQVQWYVDYRVFNLVTGAIITPTEDTTIGCYLFGTRVLLNFNTSI